MYLAIALQGKTESKQTIIGNYVWIGRCVMMSLGWKITDGSIIAMRCVLTRISKVQCCGGMSV